MQLQSFINESLWLPNVNTYKLAYVQIFVFNL